MKLVRWPELDQIESNLKVIDEFYISTEKGPILRGYLFHPRELDKLQNLKVRIEAKKKELSAIEAEIYSITHDFS